MRALNDFTVTYKKKAAAAAAAATKKKVTKKKKKKREERREQIGNAAIIELEYKSVRPLLRKITDKIRKL